MRDLLLEIDSEINNSVFKHDRHGCTYAKNGLHKRHTQLARKELGSVSKRVFNTE